MDGSLFVAHEHMSNGKLGQRMIQVDDASARDAKDDIDLLLNEALANCLCA
jgi:hypothetical protein